MSRPRLVLVQTDSPVRDPGDSLPPSNVGAPSHSAVSRSLIPTDPPSAPAIGPRPFLFQDSEIAVFADHYSRFHVEHIAHAERSRNVKSASLPRDLAGACAWRGDHRAAPAGLTLSDHLLTGGILAYLAGAVWLLVTHPMLREIIGGTVLAVWAAWVALGVVFLAAAGAAR